MNGITIDGTYYDVRVDFGSFTRAFTVISGSNAGTAMTGREIPDIVGTGYTYTMTVEPNPGNRAAYDSFFTKISSPVDYVTVTLPYAQTTISFKARVVGGQDHYQGTINGKNKWGGMSVTFRYIEPSVTP